MLYSRCKTKGVTPIVTLHYARPEKWLENGSFFHDKVQHLGILFRVQRHEKSEKKGGKLIWWICTRVCKPLSLIYKLNVKLSIKCCQPMNNIWKNAVKLQRWPLFRVWNLMQDTHTHKKPHPVYGLKKPKISGVLLCSIQNEPKILRCVETNFLKDPHPEIICEVSTFTHVSNTFLKYSQD